MVGRGRFELPIPWNFGPGTMLLVTQTKNHSQARPPTHAVFHWSLLSCYKNNGVYFRAMVKVITDC